jgi:hypothetical protein
MSARTRSAQKRADRRARPLTAMGDDGERGAEHGKGQRPSARPGDSRDRRESQDQDRGDRTEGRRACARRPSSVPRDGPRQGPRRGAVCEVQAQDAARCRHHPSPAARAIRSSPAPTTTAPVARAPGHTDQTAKRVSPLSKPETRFESLPDRTRRRFHTVSIFNRPVRPLMRAVQGARRPKPACEDGEIRHSAHSHGSPTGASDFLAARYR